MGTERLHLWRALKLRKKTALTVLTLGSAVTLLALLVFPRKYMSSASILLRLGRENLAVDPTVVSETTVSPGDRKRENEINSEVQILRSRWLAESAIERVGPGPILNGRGLDLETAPEEPTWIETTQALVSSSMASVKSLLTTSGLSTELTEEELALRKFQLSLGVKPIRNSDVIELNYLHRNAATARELLAAALELYLTRHLEVRQTQGAIPFFETQSQEAEGDLLACEESHTSFRKKHEIHSIKTEREILLQKIADVEKEAADFEGWLHGEQQRRLRFLAELATEPLRVADQSTDGKPNYGLTPVYERLAQLYLDESSLSSRFTDQYQPLRDVREQIERLRQFQGELPSTLKEDQTKQNPVYVNLNSEIVHAEAQIRSLEEKLKRKRSFLASSHDRLSHLERIEAEEKRLGWETDLSRERLSRSLIDLDHARTNFALDLERISNVSIIDPPCRPIKPLGPSRVLLLLCGLGFTLMVSLGLVLVLEYTDRTFKSPEEISEMLQLPTIATVRRGYELESFSRI